MPVSYADPPYKPRLAEIVEHTFKIFQILFASSETVDYSDRAIACSSSVMSAGMSANSGVLR